VAWLRDFVGFAAGGEGVLTSGGSIGNLLGLALARERTGPGQDLVFYLSPETHASVQKGLRFLGFGREAIRVIKTDDQFRMSAKALAESVAWDKEKGRRPAAVVATAGTVGCGAVDPLETLADFCSEEGLWLHVDGAFGALAAAAPTGAWMRRGLCCADSLSLDPHKWLFVPIDASCLLVRDGAHLRRLFSIEAEYLRLRGAEAAGDFHHPMESSLELTRRFRALKIWMSIKTEGAGVLRERIEGHLQLARRLGEWVRATPGFELLAPVATNVVCFRRTPEPALALPPTERARALDRLNEELLERVNRAGGLFLSHCRLRGAYSLRACVTGLRTTGRDLERLCRVVEEASSAVEKELSFC
jgi:aromatic-L-amino-acid decarboxylase